MKRKETGSRRRKKEISEAKRGAGWLLASSTQKENYI